MAVDSTSIPSLIGNIYDAVLEPRRWPAVLDRVCDATGSVGAMLITMDLRQPGSSRVVFARLDPVLMSRYLKNHAAADPWTAVATRLPVGGVFALDAFVPEATLVRSPLYADILRSKDIRHAATSILCRDGERVAAMSVYRAGRRGAYGPQACGLLDALAPHLRRAQDIASRLRESASMQDSMAAALDALTQGVIVLDAHGKVLFANRPAEAVFEAGDGLCLAGGRLRAGTAAETARLNALLSLAARGGGGSLRIARAAGRRPYVLQAVAVAEGRLETAGAAAAVLALVAELEPRPENDTGRLAHLFGLTPAEARVAAAVASGDGVPRAARALGLSTNTVHTHLRRVFAKLDVRSQAGLARVLQHASAVGVSRPGCADREPD